MSERKYRQRGYQDDGARDRDRGPAPQGPKTPAGPRERPEGPRSPKMMGFHDVVRCHRCGTIVQSIVVATSTCVKCGVALHACAQCVSFNPASRFECMQEIPARVAPKDTFNTCALFEARTTVERETGSVKQTSARSAFDDLFKF
ncbi:MAG: hypothetical protein Q7V01_13585 [Vicinamibacterales bacterium]|nr:hypothetical protein [Vicinamibacterales bacterium]